VSIENGIRETPLEPDIQSSATPAQQSRKYPWAMMVVALLFVLTAFASWYGSWFGRTLSDEKVHEYLTPTARPRDTQHALEQIVKRIAEKDPSVKQFYPSIIAAAQNPTPQVRQAAAWAMGEDNTYQEFHPVLRSMLEDSDPTVRHNAALQLIRFGDSSGRVELVRMLEPVTLRAQTSGIVEFLIKEEGLPVGIHAPVARVKQDDGKTLEIRAVEAARIESLLVTDGSRVEAETEILRLSPSTDQIWEALRGLYFIGQADDLEPVKRYMLPAPGVPDHVQRQAQETAKAIQGRGK
jgi:hypothetical protein